MLRNSVLLDDAALLEDVQVNFRSLDEAVGDDGGAGGCVPAIGEVVCLERLSWGPGALREKQKCSVKCV